MGKTRVALITHDIATGGGTAAMTRFLYRVLCGQSEFEARIISLATSASDTASIRLGNPALWLSRPRVEEREIGGISYTPVGARFPEFEFQRYGARGPLRDLLAGFQILQYVVGIASWACTAGERLPEASVWFATTARNDRASRIEESRGLRRLNYTVMTAAAEVCERKALREASSIVALSDYSADSVKALVPASRLQTIPCGIDTAAFHPERSHRGDYILCVGRLEDPRKNVRLLLEAYLSARARDAHLPDLYLVGEPPGEALAEEIRTSPAASHIHVLGLRRGEELAALYRGAMMLVVPSDEEGLGIVILEAMASGIPVVSTRCGGPEMAVTEGITGFLTPKGDAKALRDAILRLAGDVGLRRTMGENAVDRAREVFSLQAVGNRFLGLFRALSCRT